MNAGTDIPENSTTAVTSMNKASFCFDHYKLSDQRRIESDQTGWY